jgi:hypothetical protein
MPKFCRINPSFTGIFASPDHVPRYIATGASVGAGVGTLTNTVPGMYTSGGGHGAAGAANIVIVALS